MKPCLLLLRTQTTTRRRGSSGKRQRLAVACLRKIRRGCRSVRVSVLSAVVNPCSLFAGPRSTHSGSLHREWWSATKRPWRWRWADSTTGCRAAPFFFNVLACNWTRCAGDQECLEGREAPMRIGASSELETEGNRNCEACSRSALRCTTPSGDRFGRERGTMSMPPSPIRRPSSRRSDFTNRPSDLLVAGIDEHSSLHTQGAQTLTICVLTNA